MRRRMVIAPSFVVDINLLNIVCSPWMLEFRWPQAGPCGRGGCGDRDYTQVGQVGGAFPANENERRCPARFRVQGIVPMPCSESEGTLGWIRRFRTGRISFRPNARFKGLCP